MPVLAPSTRMQRDLAGKGDYWSFTGHQRRQHAHGLLSYPAMMIPEMMGEMLRRLRIYDRSISMVYDPFVGSGTVLVESMLRGLDFYGTDINPLAVLACRVKAGPYNAKSVAAAVAQLLKVQAIDHRIAMPEFPGRAKWFGDEVSRALATIAHSVRRLTAVEVRRVLWLALANVARTVSNSRGTTYKLHKRANDEVPAVAEDVFSQFHERLSASSERMNQFWKQLEQAGHARNGRYHGEVRIDCTDVRNATTALPPAGVDLLLTSPPYGDNTSTIPYGQYSYLPLNWVDLDDIGSDALDLTIENPYAIDRLSLGGSILGGDARAEILRPMSPTFANVHTRLRLFPKDRQKRLTAFVYDLHVAITCLAPRVRSGGHMVWVVGDRRIGGRSIQLSAIVTELLAAAGFSLQACLQRRIPSKKMAMRNSLGKTMQEETILGFRRD